MWLSSKMKRIRISLLFHLIGNISSRVGTYEAKIHGTPAEFFWSASKADNGTAHCIYTMLLFMLRSVCNQRETTCSVLPVMAKYVSMYVLSLSCVIDNHVDVNINGRTSFKIGLKQNVSR